MDELDKKKLKSELNKIFGPHYCKSCGAEINKPRFQKSDPFNPDYGDFCFDCYNKWYRNIPRNIWYFICHVGRALISIPKGIKKWWMNV